MNRSILSLALGLAAGAVLTLAPAIPARATDATAVAAAKTSLQEAVNHGDVAAILAARARFIALADAEPKNARLQYWVALCDWRVAPLLQEKDKKRAAQYCKDGVTRCDQALKNDPKLADAIALKGGLQGLGIGLDLYNPIAVSLSMEGAFKQARELAPENPRVALLDAMNTLYKPEFVGGGPERASKVFERAIALADKDVATADPLAADWGKDDVYLWAGRAAVQLENYARAKELFQKALVANPDNGWVRGALLPQVEKKLAEKGNS